MDSIVGLSKTGYFNLRGFIPLDGKQLVKMARSMFNLSPTDPITMDQLNYVLGMSRPSNYIVQHHTIKGSPITFNIPDHDLSRALGHRP